MNGQTTIIEKLRDSLPVVFGRSEVDSLMPGILHSKTLANMDSAGAGPPHYKQGRKVFYERDSFLEWFSRRIRKVEA